MTWTRFMDMHSGGGLKLDYEYIYIEAEEHTAKLVFQNMFGRNPEHVTCDCCGGDYSIGEETDIAQATAYERGCAYSDAEKKYVEQPDTRYSYSKKYLTLDEYRKVGSCFFITTSEITHELLAGELYEDDTSHED